jgi:hypothetical protein
MPLAMLLSSILQPAAGIPSLGTALGFFYRKKVTRYFTVILKY